MLFAYSLSVDLMLWLMGICIDGNSSFFTKFLFSSGPAASFTLPEKGNLLEDILFVELCREEAQKLLTSYKEEATRLLPTPVKRKRQKKRPHKRPIDAHGEENSTSARVDDNHNEEGGT